jgi:hypothetical protein
VPLIDGLVCGVHQAALLASLGHPKATAGSYDAPGARGVSNVAPALAARFGRDEPR